MPGKSRAAHVRKILGPDKNAGHILRAFAGLEWDLDLLLTRYFTAQERFFEFKEIIIGRFTTRQKIEILRKMALPRKMKARDNAVISLEKLLTLRNMVAHSAHLLESDCLRLASDNEIWHSLVDYPKSFNLAIRDVRNRITNLTRSYLALKCRDET